jgi:hypothetical protein
MIHLHTLLGVEIDNFCLVVDNAQSPTDPVSFHKQRSSCGGSSSSTKSKWSSMPPCVEIENKGPPKLQDTSCSHSIMVEKSGETSGSGVPPVCIPILQLRRELIQNERKSQFSSLTVERSKSKRHVSCQLRPSSTSESGQT